MARAMLSRPRRRTPGLMLIPLVDVIFLLLTFFILASRIDPFSLLTLDEYELRSEGASPGAAAPAAVPDLILAISRASVQANGETIPLRDFIDRSAALRRQGLETVTLFTRPSATVQDVTTVLDALKKAAFRSVVIRGGNAAAG